MTGRRARALLVSAWLFLLPPALWGADARAVFEPVSRSMPPAPGTRHHRGAVPHPCRRFLFGRIGQRKDVRLAWVKFTLHAFDDVVAHLRAMIALEGSDKELSGGEQMPNVAAGKFANVRDVSSRPLYRLDRDGLLCVAFDLCHFFFLLAQRRFHFRFCIQPLTTS